MLLLVAALMMLAGCGTDPRLPNLVGLPLDDAKTTAESAGFSDVDSHDALRSRAQFADGNWQVCTQDPAPGPTDTDTRIDVGVVRTEETCPGATPTTATTTTSTTPPPITTTSGDVDADGDLDRPRTRVPSVPLPDPEVGSDQAPRKTRSGRSGHICLLGERDGDGDGYCGE